MAPDVHPLGCDPLTWEDDLRQMQARALREARIRAGLTPLLSEHIPIGTLLLTLLAAGGLWWVTGIVWLSVGGALLVPMGLVAAFALTQVEACGRGGAADRLFIEELMRLDQLCFEVGAPQLDWPEVPAATVYEWPLAEAPRLVERWRLKAEAHFG